MFIEPEEPWYQQSLSALRLSLNAQAAGVWRVEVDHLRQLGFDAATDMPRDVSQGFAQATLTVSLDLTSLGIVIAANERRRVVSVATDLPVEVGSGYWLHGFEAARSVAVPIMDDLGKVLAVVAVALPTLEPSDVDVETALRSAASAWF